MEGPRQREGAPSAAETRPGAGQEGLPELQLTQLQRSEKPINEVNGTHLKVESIEPWNTYTIVSLEGHDEIRVLDEEARVIPEFRAPLSSKKIEVNWNGQEVKGKVRQGTEYIGIDTATQSDVTKISQLPLELRGFARAELAVAAKGGATIQEFQRDRVGTKTYVASDVVVLDRYVVLTTKEGGYFAYATCNEHGIVLPPQNWKRIGPHQPIPADLNERVEGLLGEHDGYKEINERYSALVTDVGINIVENERGKGVPIFSDLIPSIERNITVDPANPNIIYYCQSSNPRIVTRLDLGAELQTWEPVTAKLPQGYTSISNLQLDPSGNFFLFYSQQDLVVITKEGLREVKRIPNLTHVNFDSQGRIRAVDKEGHLVIYEANFNELVGELERERIARLAEGIDLASVFDVAASSQQIEVEGGGFARAPRAFAGKVYAAIWGGTRTDHHTGWCGTNSTGFGQASRSTAGGWYAAG